jgi:DNA polymerase-3 subunit delta'
VVGADGRLPLPWLATPLREALKRRGHALLVTGPAGVGQFELALVLAQAWLCEGAAGAPRPCGRCAGCRLLQARSHPDLLVLLPEAMRVALAWESGSDEDEEGAGERASKARPSKEIKVEAVRAAVEFAQTTAARSRGKVVVVHPAERTNPIAANALLKTLEEPPGAARFVLGCATPDALLPTIRSRCEVLRLATPPAEEAVSWLAAQGVREPAILLAACGGQPLEALAWSGDGVEGKLWQQLPALLARGEAAPFASWPVPRLVDALHKLCHDALCAAAGAPARYFPAGTVPATARLDALDAWARELARIARHAEHPWNAGLTIEALVEGAKNALRAAPADARPPRGKSLHSGA